MYLHWIKQSLFNRILKGMSWSGDPCFVNDVFYVGDGRCNEDRYYARIPVLPSP